MLFPPSPFSTCTRVTYNSAHRNYVQRYALNIQVLCLCMPKNHSYQLQQMFEGTSIMRALQYHARGTGLISCSLSRQGMGALLRQCEKPQMGRQKSTFHCSEVALIANEDDILCSYCDLHLGTPKCFTNIKMRNRLVKQQIRIAQGSVHHLPLGHNRAAI